MGQKEFYSPIKSDIDEMRLLVDRIDTTTTKLEQTDVANLETKIDNLSSFETMQKDNIFYTTSNGVTDTIVDITGKKGFFSLSVLNPYSSTYELRYVEIIVDGVTLENFYSVSVGGYCYSVYNSLGELSAEKKGSVNSTYPTATKPWGELDSDSTHNKQIVSKLFYVPFENSLKITLSANSSLRCGVEVFTK